MKKMFKIIGIILGALLIIGLINFAPMVSLKTPGMEEYNVDGITIYAKLKDADEAERIGKRINENRTRVTASLGDANAEGIDVIVYPNRQALKRKTLGFTGLLLPQWYIGKNSRDKVLIVTPAEPGPAHTRESIEQAAVHEYVHVLTDRQNKSMDYWLKEGFALYLAEQIPPAEMVKQHLDITYEEFSNPNAIQFAQVGGYALAYTLMEYLEEEYGWDKVLTFLNPGSNFESVTGIPEREFFENWKSWVSTLS